MWRPQINFCTSAVVFELSCGQTNKQKDRQTNGGRNITSWRGKKSPITLYDFRNKTKRPQFVTYIHTYIQTNLYIAKIVETNQRRWIVSTIAIRLPLSSTQLHKMAIKQLNEWKNEWINEWKSEKYALASNQCFCFHY